MGHVPAADKIRNPYLTQPPKLTPTQTSHQSHPYTNCLSWHPPPFFFLFLLFSVRSFIPAHNLMIQQIPVRGKKGRENEAKFRGLGSKSQNEIRMRTILFNSNLVSCSLHLLSKAVLFCFIHSIFPLTLFSL